MKTMEITPKITRREYRKNESNVKSKIRRYLEEIRELKSRIYEVNISLRYFTLTYGSNS